ncbi:HD-GYP domain-containing protein [Methylomonas paludis]|uniref:HD-GYP domain-containing protein n=1 Tax=Methylomonas paludis TaxID=1173101 RepID=A0A975MR09_9GAMM|nr:HD-GYP domain-containing protein [Methylomonas paludis]QWF71936.1 HD-GYP domain-containing protein [Methylomonas paludis]
MTKIQRPGFSASHTIYRKILQRLFLGWLLLCLVLGGGMLWLEIDRIEQFVRILAMREAQILSAESVHNLAELDGKTQQHLHQLAEKLVEEHFLVVELYDLNKTLQLEAVRKGSEAVEYHANNYRHKFPQADGFSHEMHLIDDQMLLVILVPLKSRFDDSQIGYFEGVYQVDQGTFAKIRQDVLRTLIFVSLGTSFATLLMYPMVVTLIRGVVKLSGVLLQGNLELLDVLGCAISERDAETNSHNYRVTYYALKLGEAAGLSADSLRRLLAGAFLHDVGKIGIRDPILLKPGKLTPAEFEVMKTHVSLGVDIVAKSSWLSGAREVVECHHEKFDGSGYPRGLVGKQIPVNARIFAIVDVFDALTSVRPYKSAWSINEALTHLQAYSGSHFDPQLLALFTDMAVELYQEVSPLDTQQLENLLHPLFGQYFFVVPGKLGNGDSR